LENVNTSPFTDNPFLVNNSPAAESLSQNFSATSNAKSSAGLFSKEKETSEMLAGSAALSIGDEKFNYFVETFESAENFNPDLSAGSSSDDPVGPAAKKVKLDLPHTRVHNGETLLLSDYGLKNYEKLLNNKQLERGVPAKECQECKEVMDWRTDGPITKGKKSWYFYQPRHNGICKKKVSDEHYKVASTFDKELKDIDTKLVVLSAKKVKNKEDIQEIAELSSRRELCVEKGWYSKYLAYDKELKEIESMLAVLSSKKVKNKEDIQEIAELSSRREFCFQNGRNSKYLAYDKALKEIESMLAVLSSKKVKNKEDIQEIADLAGRREFCFQNGRNSKAAPIKKQAAADNRANGNCPGYPYACHKTAIPQVPGRSYCSPCQIKINAYSSSAEHHASVVCSEEKRVAREQSVEMLEPIVVSLQNVDIRPHLPSETVEKLRDISQFVGVDSENHERGGMTAAQTYEWVFIDFSTGSTLHLKRFHKNWNVTIDSPQKKLISDTEAKQAVFKFVGKRTLMYFAASEGCDKKRLMDWMGYKDFNGNFNDKALSFKWFNLGYQVCFNIFGPDGAIVTPTMRLLTLFNHLYEVPDTGISVPTPPAYVPCGPLSQKCKNDVIQMFSIAQALSLSFQYHDSS
jgi:hypothetical protein